MDYWIWFACIKGMGPIQKKKLLEIYGTPEKLYNIELNELKELGILRKRDCRRNY